MNPFSFLLFVLLAQASFHFEIKTAIPALSGRLFVVIARSDRPEPRLTITEAGPGASTILARDIATFQPGSVAIIDKTAAMFPIRNLDQLAAGDYYIQAFLASNRDLKSLNAPGNLYSAVQRVRLDPRVGGALKLELTKAIPAEDLPPDEEFVKYVKIQSNLLTRFHGHPIYLRAGVVLPKDFLVDSARRFPLRIHIGGYGTRYTAVQRLMAQGSAVRKMWFAADTPSFIYLQLDGDGPYGDPYEVNSDNNGPYGDAITTELIPYIESRFHAIALPAARVLDGQSTGGWVSLALKVFYPDFFNAVWSSCPDGVDFRGFQLINIYKDANAYFASDGSEVPSKRDTDGNIEFSIRHECQMENVIGAGDNWYMSGQQWGAWNATYGPRGADGRPVPLWNPQTGVIDRSVVPHWSKYDLRLILQQNWPVLEPKLRGKFHISVGDADSYYLNNAVHLLDDFLTKAEPPAYARIVYGPGRGHCWTDVSETEMMKEMAGAVESAMRGTDTKTR